MFAIEAKDIEFSFGLLLVLRGVTLRVDQGAVVAVLGPNGAGKTTLLKVMAGLLRPSAGQVNVEGVTASEDPTGFRRLIGVISHQPYVYPRLTGRENLEFYGRLYGLKDSRAEAGRILEEMGLASAMDREAATYSRGMLQRLAVGRALLHQPRVLLLDEPFTGLDHEARAKLVGLLGSLRDGQRTVLMTTHDVDGGLELADRVALLIRGRVATEMDAGALDAASLLARYREVVAEERAAATDTMGGAAERGDTSGKRPAS